MWRGICLLPFSYIQKVEEILDVNFLLVVLIFAGGFLVVAICCILIFGNGNITKMIGEYKLSRFAGTFLWALLAVILIVHRITGIAGDFIFMSWFLQEGNSITVKRHNKIYGWFCD